MLDDTQLTALVTRLERVPGLRQAPPFGSMASDRHRADSDVDVAPLCETPSTADVPLALSAELDRAIGREIDLVDLHDVPEPLTGEALEGLALIDRNGARTDLIPRHLVNVEDLVPLQPRLFAHRRRRFLDS